ncbi:hypothetical protein J6590_005467 [Homalodisca vitripennis]|nr:hypothetical protein J6590_005467 [Homalodisca vitripennis]
MVTKLATKNMTWQLSTTVSYLRLLLACTCTLMNFNCASPRRSTTTASSSR